MFFTCKCALTPLHVQVEYYFSRENLCQDTFLVGKMDAQHFVDVAIIADFKMVKLLTTDTDLILSCVAGSDKVCSKNGAIGEERGHGTRWRADAAACQSDWNSVSVGALHAATC